VAQRPNGDNDNQAVKRSYTPWGNDEGAGLLAPLERLELAAMPIPQVCLQYGWLRKLPRDYQGERHIEIVKRLSIQEGLERVQAEELPGAPDTVRAAAKGIKR
jgi:hypothetical protein